MNIQLLITCTSFLLVNAALAKSHWLGTAPNHHRASKFFHENTASWIEGEQKRYNYKSYNDSKYVSYAYKHMRVGADNPGLRGNGVFLKSKGKWSEGIYKFNFHVWNHSTVKNKKTSWNEIKKTWHALWLEAAPTGRHRLEVDLLEGAETRSERDVPYVKPNGGQFTSQYNVYVGTSPTRVDTVVKKKWGYWYTMRRWSWIESTIRWGRNPDFRVWATTPKNSVGGESSREFDTNWSPLNWRRFGDNPPNTRRVRVIVQNRPWGYDSDKFDKKLCSTIELARFITPE